MKSLQKKNSFLKFWRPRYWPIWLVFLSIRSIVYLPLIWQIKIGKYLGRCLRRLPSKACRTAEINIKVCFPELSNIARRKLLERHFEALGASFIEMGIGWFTPIQQLRKFIRVEGRQHLSKALKKGNGVILFTAHFTTLEVGVAILQDLCDDCSCVYRPQRNTLIDTMIQKGRSRFAREQIPRNNVRAMLRNLKRNGAVVYLPDQTYAGKQSEILPFFGQPTLTNIAMSRLAKLSGAIVLPYFFKRLSDDSGYVVNIEAPLPNFPTDDPSNDTRRLMQSLEAHIRTAPEQYLWIYRKFKRRPQKYPDLYDLDRTP